jgi:hypothetical protein
MAAHDDAPADRLWREYGALFRELDDLTLARWMAQTLGQFEGGVWRLSHPLIVAYRLAAQQAVDRQTWFKRLATPPQAYTEAQCCRAPALPLLTRDVRETGLLCQHCGETLLPFGEIPPAIQHELEEWCGAYAPVHAVAHWDDHRRKSAGDYERAFELAAEEAESLLLRLGSKIAPKMLDLFPAVVWEDQDECLEVRPEDILP